MFVAAFAITTCVATIVGLSYRASTSPLATAYSQLKGIGFGEDEARKYALVWFQAADSSRDKLAQRGFCLAQKTWDRQLTLVALDSMLHRNHLRLLTCNAWPIAAARSLRRWLPS